MRRSFASLRRLRLILFLCITKLRPINSKKSTERDLVIGDIPDSHNVLRPGSFQPPHPGGYGGAAHTNPTSELRLGQVLVGKVFS